MNAQNHISLYSYRDKYRIDELNIKPYKYRYHTRTLCH